jgi:glycosyltransferase involved in cell wall biosynthesis
VPETATSPSVSFVLPVHDDWETTFGCLMSLLERSAGLRRETIVVDNGSSDATRTALPMLEGIRLIRNERQEVLAHVCNQALCVAQGDVLLLLEAGVQIADGAIPHILRRFEDAAVAAAVPAPESGLGAMLAVRTSDARAAGGWDELRHGATEALIERFVSLGRSVEMIESPRVARPQRDPLERTAPPSRAPAGPAAAPSATARPPLTVVVPVQDAGPTLATCLESLGRNLRSEDEIVISDGGSRDDTLRAAYLYAAMHPTQVRVVTSRASNGLAAALRHGLDAAWRDVLVVVHANMSAPEGFLDGVLKLLAENPGTDAIGLEVPRSGVCFAASSALSREIAGTGAEALFEADGLALAEAVRRAGARLAFVPAAP